MAAKSMGMAECDGVWTESKQTIVIRGSPEETDVSSKLGNEVKMANLTGSVIP